MKNINYWLFLTLVTFTSLGQNLQVPNTPAFSILDYEPSSVMRPSSIKKLSNDILNSFGPDGKLIMNLGLEMSPYWLKSRDTLSREQYLNPKGFQTFIQTLSISAATVKDSLTDKNNLGLGLRVQLIKGQLSKEFYKQDRLLNNYETAAAGIASTIGMIGINVNTVDDALETIKTNLDDTELEKKEKEEIMQLAEEIVKKYKAKPKDVKEYCEELINYIDQQTTNLAKKVIELEQQRIGFSLEVAAATKFAEVNNGQELQKFGFWINANNYISTTDAWTITGRIFGTDNGIKTSNTDIGLGYIKLGDSFNVALEGMLRWYITDFADVNINNEPITRVERDFTYRLATQLSYSIYENISFNLSLGKDFESAIIKKSSFFTVFGLNYSIFNKQEDLYKK